MGGLCLEGFQERRSISAERTHFGNEINRMVHVSNSNLLMDIVVSRTSAATSPIFQFHSSVVINYVSVDTFFAAYLTLTMHSIGFANLFIEFKRHITPSTLLGFNKYREHGFSIRSLRSIYLDEVFECVSQVIDFVLFNLRAVVKGTHMCVNSQWSVHTWREAMKDPDVC